MVISHFVALITYVALASLVLMHSWASLHRVFASYFLALAAWDCALLMIRAGVPDPSLWAQLGLIAALATATVYLHFMALYLRSEWLKPWVPAAYALALGSVVLASRGVIIQGVRLTPDGLLHYELGSGALWIVTPAIGFLLLTTYLLAQGFRREPVPRVRRSILLILTGQACVTLGELLSWTTPLGRYPVSAIAHIINAVLISYAIFRHHLLDLGFILRRGLGYGLAAILVAIAYLLSFFGLLKLLLVAGWGFLLAVVVIAVVVAAISPTLRKKTQFWVDRLFFHRYDPQRLLQELSHSVASELDLDVLAPLMLERVTRALNIERAYLFLDTEEGDFRLAARHDARSQEGNQADVAAANSDLRLPSDHSLVQSLAKHAVAVSRNEVMNLPGLAAAWAADQDVMARLDAEFFVPIHAKDELVGILALGGRGGGAPYDPEARIVLSTLANQTAVAIQNARLMASERAQREFAEAILQESSAGLMVVDAGLRVATVNPSAEALIGRPAAELLNRPLAEVLGAQACEAHSRLGEALRAGSRVALVELALPGPDRPRDVLVGVAPLSQGCLLSLTDITRLKEIDRLKSEFVANVSHELRTPLASIKAYTELILDDLDDSGDVALRKEFLEVINKETDRLAALINDLLDLARLQSGRPRLEKRPIVVRQVVDEVIETLRVQAQKRDIVLDVDIPEDLPPLLADKELMLMVVKNLIGNALKFSHHGGQVQVTARKVDSNLRFSVTDQGVGIPPQAIPHLFEKFFRALPTTDSGIPGTGLGLALTKEAVEAHGGSIDVESEPGAGSRFIMTLPYTQQEGQASNESQGSPG